jgi:S-(hydroxymethyl)glutathione dehydrogenase / alcohol dehydrogenase
MISAVVNGWKPRAARAMVVRDPAAPTTFETVTVAGPAFGEVRVELRAVGVCHTDYSVAKGLLPIMRLPGIPGHEGAGIVDAVGPGVTHLDVGDRVMLSSIAPCGACRRCQRGEGAYCEREETRRGVMPDGTTRVIDEQGEPVYLGFNSGLFADVAVVDAAAVVPVPDALSLDAASLLGCAVVSGWGAVVNTARVRPASSVLVFGCGGVGLSAVMTAALVGARPIVAVDPSEERRQSALDVGATHAIAPEEIDDVRGLARFGYETVIEASGAPAAVDLVFGLLQRGGTGVYVGAPPPREELSVSVLALAASGKRLVGCLTGEVRPAVDLPALAALAADGRLPIDRLVSAHRPLERVDDAFALLERGEGVRTILTFA